MILESLCGLDYHRAALDGSRIALRFDGSRLACWHRLWGVAADEIELIGVEETALRLRAETAGRIALLTNSSIAADAPGYQLFGNIRDRSRWDREVGRLAGEREIASANTWFAQQRPALGEIVVEAHLVSICRGGSITRS